MFTRLKDLILDGLEDAFGHVLDFIVLFFHPDILGRKRRSLSRLEKCNCQKNSQMGRLAPCCSCHGTEIETGMCKKLHPEFWKAKE